MKAVKSMDDNNAQTTTTTMKKDDILYKDRGIIGKQNLLQPRYIEETIIAIKETIVWCLELSDYRKIKRANRIARFLRRQNEFKSVSLDKLKELGNGFHKVAFENAEQIIKEGNDATCMYMLIEGKLKAKKMHQHTV